MLKTHTIVPHSTNRVLVARNTTGHHRIKLEESGKSGTDVAGWLTNSPVNP